ncbi:MAG TPA: glutamyl-tRNA reductase, partial [Burkholderiaceae bacterium]|nr:glutamyl-tRNA reductase [Burkholderiaceae bacterium]
MMERVATHFQGYRPRSLVVANRTLARGAALAAKLGGAAMPLSELPARLAEFDVVVSCTASAVPLIERDAVERALKARKRRPMLLFDLAVPRDIDAEVGRLPDAYLHSLDDLAERVQGASAHRQAAVRDAETLVDDGVRSFGRWMAERDQVPLIRSLQEQAAAWRSDELARARRGIARGDDMDAVLEEMARRLTGKMLHGPLAALHAQAQEPSLVDSVTRMFLRAH